MRGPVAQLSSSSLTIAGFSQQPAHWKNSVLGAICFGTDGVLSRIDTEADMPCARVPMGRLDGDDSICEVWHASGPLSRGQRGEIQYRHDENVLFGVISLPETKFEAGVDKTPLQQAAESAYRQVFALLEALRYPYLLRFWNYLADINADSFGLERYRQFNLGRQDAFLAHGREVEGNVPAACALGSSHGPLTLAFLAARVAPMAIENPRQISAYQYPRQYGPRKPTFSRASLLRLRDNQVLFVSGTASIVGHATLHAGDAVAQTRETMINIEAVLTEANRLASPTRFDLASLNYKVYLRQTADLARIRAEFERIVGRTPNAAYLQADVCRHDLLVEIEATAGQPLAVASGRRG